MSAHQEDDQRASRVRLRRASRLSAGWAFAFLLVAPPLGPEATGASLTWAAGPPPSVSSRPPTPSLTPPSVTPQPPLAAPPPLLLLTPQPVARYRCRIVHVVDAFGESRIVRRCRRA